ncbi:MAG: SBBP repeat-containing protein, partial [Deltaproteobacteria bacterium]|nr:SBBP repeat-containing protein [Deltaproteobacteria bacterium]
MGTVKMTTPVAYQEINGKRVKVTAAYLIKNSDKLIPQSAIQNLNSISYGFAIGEYNKDYPLIIDPLLASTFIGGSDMDWTHDLAIDSSGNVFVTGWTRSSDYPTTAGAYDESYNGDGGDFDVLVSKLSNDLSTLSASAFIGGSSNDWGYDIIIVNDNIFL